MWRLIHTKNPPWSIPNIPPIIWRLYILKKKTSHQIPQKNRDRQHRWFVASSPKWCTCTTSSHLKPCSPSTFNGLTIIFQAMYPIFLPEKIHHVLGISQLGPSRNSSTDGRSFLSVCFAWARGVQKTSQIFRLNHPQNRHYEVGKKSAFQPQVSHIIFAISERIYTSRSHVRSEHDHGLTIGFNMFIHFPQNLRTNPRTLEIWTWEIRQFYGLF